MVDSSLSAPGLALATPAVGMSSSSSSTPAKRQKVRQEERADTAGIASGSQDRRRHVFEPFLAMGIVANEVPLLLQVRHGGKDADKPDVNVITSLGDCWSIWTAESLVQVFVGSQLPVPITQLALSTSPDSILASAGAAIYRFVRGRVVATYQMPSDAHVTRFVVVGDNLLALTTPSGTAGSFVLHQFSLATRQVNASMDLSQQLTPTSLLHPTTYLHKVLVGYSNGVIQLWNTRAGNLVHQFDAAELRAKHGIHGGSAASIACMAQTPALDVIAIVTSDSHVLLHDVQRDVAIMTFSLEAQLSATPPTFRTDGRAHTMAIGSRSGDIFIFDLEPQEEVHTQGGLDSDDDGGEAQQPSARVNAPRLVHTIRNAHADAVTGLEFVPGQPLLITSSSDNSVKEWFFEPTSDSTAGSTASSSSLPRLLKSRSGHSAPPSLVRWYGEDGRAPLLTAGRDRSVRLGWVGREARGGELSQGSIVRKANQLSLPPQALKLEPATSLSFALTRSRDWDDILTVHPSSPPRTWFGKDRRMKTTPLAAADKKKSAADGEATTGFVSHCGNFALAGTSTGLITMWNMQSGRWVRHFDTRPLLETTASVDKKSSKRKEIRGKGSKVVGIVADEGNTEVAVVTADGSVHVFDFVTSQLLSSQQFHPLAGVRASPHATLLALIPVGLMKPLLLLDLQTRRIVRRFADLPGRVTDVAFSPTLRSLVAATMDGSLSTFDVPSGLLIDRIRLREVIVSLDWSPDGSMLAGCGTEGKGVYLWSWTSGRGRVETEGDEEMVAKDGQETLTTASRSMMPSVRGPQAETDDADDAANAVDSLCITDDAAVETYKPSSDPLVVKNEDGQGETRPLVTLTSEPRTKWTTLLNLETLKARDRPLQAAQKPGKNQTPFFLGAAAAAPTSAIGSAGTDAVPGNGSNGISSASKDERHETLLEQMTRSDLLHSERSLTERLLDQWKQQRDSTSQDNQIRRPHSEQLPASQDLFTSHLLQLSPPQLDLAIRLELSTRTSIALLIEACADRVQSGRDFEGLSAIVETIRRVRADDMFPSRDLLSIDSDMKANGTAFEDLTAEEGSDLETVEIDELRQAWSRWLRALNQANRRIGDLLDYNLGTLSFLRGVPVI
ncbi:unnamed protein product [Parajaminaea phylloscopi]